MKRTCGNCKALSLPSYGGDTGQRCTLGYKQKEGKMAAHGKTEVTIMCPDEECPKPKTYKELIAQTKEGKMITNEMRKDIETTWSEMVNDFAKLAEVKINGYINTNAGGAVDMENAMIEEIRELFIAFMLNYASSYKVDKKNVDNLRMMV